MTAYKHVRAIERGLDVLAALNRANGASAGAISLETGIHRTTVQRVLETLDSLGYVRRTVSDRHHRLTAKVRMLADGYDEESWVREIAAPALGRLLRTVQWPTDIATYEENAMVIRETTHRFSPFSIHTAMVGRRLPMLTTALGRAYLAFAAPDRADLALASLAATSSPDGMLARDTRTVGRLIERTRKAGYATSVGELEAKIGAFALPIRHAGEAVACINCVFFLSAMTAEEAVARYLAPVMAEVAAIEAELAATMLSPA